ncbi:golgin IMH1 isoform X1 [Quillaja saponaria]|uniref:Golgin IMH1 isoform X1 n=1 Tax=Quillaja saponaria TaxID=32244 RepID=A0AAD7KPD0_QUISA|nr:golgin IMH1 isoform X1 [Quillaja saponaria]
MELLILSKFKLQLQALVHEVRELRERERSATEQHLLDVQKQKQTEGEHNRQLQELQAELALSNEERQKIERKVSYLQNDNTLLENKQKELNGTVHNLLQSRESFVNAYEESTCEMKRSIEIRDRKLSVLSQKINSHLLLFDSIEKEFLSVKHVVDKVQTLVNEKEEVVASLKSKMDLVSVFEKTFVENICALRNKLKNNEDELRRKDKVISELEAKLEVAKISNNFQTQIEDLQNTLSVKDAVIQNLISEKEALHFEVGSLRLILQKIQDTVTCMNQEDKRVFSSILQQQEGSDLVMEKENNRIEVVVQDTNDEAPEKVAGSSQRDNAMQISSDSSQFSSLLGHSH